MFCTLYQLRNSAIKKYGTLLTYQPMNLTIRYQIKIYKQCKKRLNRIIKKNKLQLDMYCGEAEGNLDDSDSYIDELIAQDINLLTQIMSNMFIFTERLDNLE